MRLFNSGYGGGNNRVSGVTIGSTTERAFTYDSAGNITQDSRSGTAYAYTYNTRNRLHTVTVAGSLKGTYTYNGLEQLAIRVSTNQTPAGTTHFIHDIFGNVIAETAGGGATGSTGTVREYIWLYETEIAPTMASRAEVDRPLAVVNAVNTVSPTLWFVHVDHLNRPKKMTDGAKATVWDADWAPWGSPYAITGSATLDARFPGQWYQMEAGLHYNWHRHYDPTLGRYTQPDPLGFVDGPSVYAYARNSPQLHVDQEGRAVQLPALFCLRFPRLCREIADCASNPASCKRKICKTGRALYTAMCNVPGCYNSQEPRTVLAFKYSAAEGCQFLRELVGANCYPADRDQNHLRKITEAKKKAKQCREMCFPGDVE